MQIVHPGMRFLNQGISESNVFINWRAADKIEILHRHIQNRRSIIMENECFDIQMNLTVFSIS